MVLIKFESYKSVSNNFINFTIKDMEHKKLESNLKFIKIECLTI